MIISASHTSKGKKTKEADGYGSTTKALWGFGNGAAAGQPAAGSGVQVSITTRQRNRYPTNGKDIARMRGCEDARIAGMEMFRER